MPSLRNRKVKGRDNRKKPNWVCWNCCLVLDNNKTISLINGYPYCADCYVAVATDMLGEISRLADKPLRFNAYTQPWREKFYNRQLGEEWLPTIYEYVKGKCFGCGAKTGGKYCGVCSARHRPYLAERRLLAQCKAKRASMEMDRTLEGYEKHVATPDVRCKHCNDEIGTGMYVAGVSPSNADMHELCDACYLTQPYTTSMQAVDQLNHGLKECKKDIGLAIVRVLRWLRLHKK